MIHFRIQRGSLEESLRTIVAVQTRGELIVVLRRVLAPLPVATKDVRIRYYTYDERIGWPTYLVTVNGEAVGFTDGRL